MELSEVLQNAIDAAARGSFFALIALGVALLFGIMNLVNFAYGELIMASGYSMLIFTDWFFDVSVWPLLIIWTIGVAVLFALAQERFAFRTVRKAAPTTMLVTSFAVSVLLVNIAVAVWGGLTVSVPLAGVTLEQFVVEEVRIRKLDLITLGTAAFLLLCLTLFLKKTPAGIQMRAASENFQMSQLLGVPANRVIATAFVIAGIFAGSVGLIAVGNLGGVTPGMGLFPLIFGLVAVVIGGMRSLVGAVVGGFVLGGLVVGLEQGLATYDLERFRDAFVFLVVILVLVFRPQGLIAGRAGRERV
ncbi:MAG: branched-chain amino acid ABC transporter permease [Gaiellaceae bacterium]